MQKHWYYIGCITIKDIGDYKSIYSANYLEKKFIKTKFNSDNNLSLNKLLEIHNLTKVVRSVFQEDNKYYSQIFLDECLYEL